jgi:hypothetical protein
METVQSQLKWVDSPRTEQQMVVCENCGQKVLITFSKINENTLTGPKGATWYTRDYSGKCKNCNREYKDTIMRPE